ncbi:hypothetical protein N0V90_003782 [Kalmusia sp. IMI 367209]|nr:hypothetical protein N0V90_003782 [Kalmusia sp. IMI 367209]
MASSTISPFLALPGELRNRIIQYALTSPSQTLYYNHHHDHAHSNHKPLFTGPTGREFNQLKYVCRQLYAETAGLEIKYNTLRFELPEDDADTLARIQNSTDNGDDALNACPRTSFPPFLYQCSRARLAWVRGIVITIRKPASYSLSQPAVDRLLSLARFTRDNPRIHIAYEYVDDRSEYYRPPKYQLALPWLSAAVCLGLAVPVPAAWQPAVNTLWSVCGRGNLLLWSIGFGIWDLVGSK